MSVISLREIYQLKVTLIGLKPPIWRRILVPSNISLGKLHLVLQISMGWTNSHLHQFILGSVFYGIKDEDFGVEDESDIKIKDLLTSEKDSIKYEYDFGDGWMHKLVLEKVLPFDGHIKHPTCIKGKRACPPEDCGGIWGYQGLIETLNDPKHPEYEGLLEWLGEPFDAEAFDVDEVNEMLVEYVQ